MAAETYFDISHLKKLNRSTNNTFTVHAYSIILHSSQSEENTISPYLCERTRYLILLRDTQI